MKSLWNKIKRLGGWRQKAATPAATKTTSFEQLEPRLLLDGDGLLPIGPTMGVEDQPVITVDVNSSSPPQVESTIPQGPPSVVNPDQATENDTQDIAVEATVQGEQGNDIGSPALNLWGTSPALFVENRGQWDDPSIRYLHDGEGMDIAVTDAGLTFYATQFVPEPNEASADWIPGDSYREAYDTQTYDRQDLIFTTTFLGSSIAGPEGRNKSETLFNYYGDDESDWQEAVPTYEKVVYDELYEGIDLHLWGQTTNLKYEFHVEPGCDYEQIVVQYEGIEGLSLAADGSLTIDLGTGWETLTDDTPYIYQEIDGRQIQVAGQFVLLDDNSYGFDITGDIDTNHTLVIDPFVAWSTAFSPVKPLGINTGMSTIGLGVDKDGNSYVAGNTEYFKGGHDDGIFDEDTYVKKIDKDGKIAWQTHNYQSQKSHSAKLHGILVDAEGNTYTLGQQQYNFGDPHFYEIRKLDPQQGSLKKRIALPSGFRPLKIKSDIHGNKYVLGSSNNRSVIKKLNSSDVLVGGIQPSLHQGQGIVDFAMDSEGNIFASVIEKHERESKEDENRKEYNYQLQVAKFTPGGNLVWTTYISDREHPYDWSPYAKIEVATAGDDSYYIAYAIDGNVYLRRINDDGSIGWSEQLGGANNDYLGSIAPDEVGNVYVTGYTYTSGWVSGGFDVTHGGSSDVYISVFSANGDNLWSTYLGGPGYDGGRDIAVDQTGCIYLLASGTNWEYGGSNATSNQNPVVVKIPTTVGGKVQVTDTNGTVHSLPYVAVKLEEGPSNQSPVGRYNLTIHANKDGEFAFPMFDDEGDVIPAGATNCTLRVELKYQPDDVTSDLFEVTHDNDPVYVKATSFKVGPENTIDFGNLASWQLNSTIPQDRYDDLAVIYSNEVEWWHFVRSELKYTPVSPQKLEVIAFSSYADSSGTALYIIGINSIYLDTASSRFGNSDQPDNAEWHESSHYLMDNTIGLGVSITGQDTNHGGYNNHSTGDSWTEGYAEFLPLALKFSRSDTHWFKYAGFGSLETNYKSWDDEEFAIVGVLVDLIDGIDVYDDDHVEIDFGRLWSIIGRNSSLDYFADVYDQLAIPGNQIGQSDADNDGITDLDEIFIAHGFFVDSNNNRSYDSGEEIGRAADGTNASRLSRRNKPQVQGANLFISAESAAKALTSGQIVITFNYPSPWDGYNYQDIRSLTSLKDGLIYLHPGPSWINPTISVSVLDDSGEPSDSIQFTMDEYREMVSVAAADYAVAHKFIISATDQTFVSDIFIAPISDNPDWLTAYIELMPAEFPEDISLAQVKAQYINGEKLTSPIVAANDTSFPFVQTPITVDRDADGKSELLVRFSKVDFLAALATVGSELESVTIGWTDSKGDLHEGTAMIIDAPDIDITAPIVTINPLTSKADRTPELTGTVDDPEATIAVTVNGSEYEATNNGDSTWTLADDTIAPALLNGTYDIVVTATDLAGNVGTDDTVDELMIALPTRLMTVELRDSTGQLIKNSGARVQYFGVGGLQDFGNGFINNDGTEQMEVSPSGMRVYLTYQGHRKQMWSRSPVVTFNTRSLTVELRDSTGELIENSNAKVQWWRGSEIADLGDGILDADGSQQVEIFVPGTRIYLTYQGYRKQTWNSSPIVTFRTRSLTVELRDSSGQLIEDSNAKLQWWRNNQITDLGDGLLDDDGSEQLEVFIPGTRLYLTYQGYRKQTWNNSPVATFSTRSLTIEYRDRTGQLIQNSKAKLQWLVNGKLVDLGDGLLDDSGTEQMEAFIPGTRLYLTHAGQQIVTWNSSPLATFWSRWIQSLEKKKDLWPL